MKRTFTLREKEWVFDAWKSGIGFSEIAKILASKPGTIFTILRNTGGIKPLERRRAASHLTLSEREAQNRRFDESFLHRFTFWVIKMSFFLGG